MTLLTESISTSFSFLSYSVSLNNLILLEVKPQIAWTGPLPTKSVQSFLAYNKNHNTSEIFFNPILKPRHSLEFIPLKEGSI